MPPGTHTKVTLRKGPEGSPNFCFGLYDKDGKCRYFAQADWDYPSLAHACGWSVREVNKKRGCDHEGTDGTVDCPECNTKVSEFLSAAYDWLAANDGVTFNVDNDYV